MKAPSEKHLEDWIVANPEKFLPESKDFTYLYLRPVKILARQYRVDVGIIDILAINAIGDLLVFELKKDAIDSRTVEQGLKYFMFLKQLCVDLYYREVRDEQKLLGYPDLSYPDVTHRIKVVLVGSHVKNGNTKYFKHTSDIICVTYDFDGESYNFGWAFPDYIETNYDTSLVEGVVRGWLEEQQAKEQRHAHMLARDVNKWSAN